MSCCSSYDDTIPIFHFQQMGYNPFRPHMSFASPSSGAAAANITTTAASTGAGSNGSGANVANVAGLDLDAAAVAEETTMAEVDDAFAMLLSLGRKHLIQHHSLNLMSCK